MSLTGIDKSNIFTQRLVNLRADLDVLQRQIGTGKKAETYSEIGSERSTSIALRAQVSRIESYTKNIADTDVRIDLMLASVTRLDSIARDTKSEALSLGLSLQNGSQTAEQLAAGARFDEAVNLLNQNIDGRYLFSGRTTNVKPVEDAEVILNGQGALAGFKQVAQERLEADLGGKLTDTSQLTGRLSLSAATDTVTIAESGGAYGFQFAASALSSSNPVTIPTTPPAGAPPSLSIQFLAQPEPGDVVRLAFLLPDGTQSDLQLTATRDNPPRDDEFLIDSDVNVSAQNFLSSVQNAIDLEARSTLTAASALAAGDNFFSSDPPLRVQPELVERVTTSTTLDTTSFTENGDRYGFTFDGANPIAASNPASVTITPPAGAPLSSSVQFTAPPTAGDSVSFSFLDEDGNPFTLSLNAVAVGPVGANEFVLDADVNITAANFEVAFNTAMDTLSGPEFGGASSLLANITDTVQWYKGEVGLDDPRQTALARVDQSVSIAYGARANETPLTTVLRELAVFSTFEFDVNDDTASDRYNALSLRIRDNLDDPSGRDAPFSIATELGIAQNVAGKTLERHQSTQGLLDGVIGDIENVRLEEVAGRVLALQTQLEASYAVTSSISKLSLINYL